MATQFEREWHSAANIPLVAASGAERARAFFWAMKRILTGGLGATRGLWSVVGSCDGIAAGMDGIDRIGSTANVVPASGLSNTGARSWLALESPGSNPWYVTIEARYASTNAGGADVRIYRSKPTGGVVSGAATCAPVAPDELQGMVQGGDLPGSFLTATSLQYALSSDGSFVVAVRTAAHFGAVFLFCKLAEHHANDLAPAVSIFRSSGATPTASMTTLLNVRNAMSIRGLANDAALAEPIAPWGAANQSGFTDLLLAIPTDAGIDASPDWPVYVASREPSGTDGRSIRGRLPDIYWSALLTQGACEPDNSEPASMSLGRLWIPMAEAPDMGVPIPPVNRHQFRFPPADCPPVPDPTIDATAAWWEADRLRIAFTAPIDPLHGPTLAPASYTLTAPDGPIGVASVEVAGPLLRLALNRTPPALDCTVGIAAGAVKSIAGAALPASVLPFRGPAEPTPTPAPMVPLVAVPSGATLRVWCTAQIDPTNGAPASPASYTIAAPNGPLSVVMAALEVGELAVRLTLSRDVPAEDCTITIAAGALVSIDGAANAATVLPFRGAEAPGPGPGPGPVDPPVVGGWSPPVGSRIERGQKIAFEVTSPGGVETVIAWVRFDDLRAADLVFDGRTFRGHYVGTVEEIPDGRRFTIRRASSGWMSRPVIVVHATNCHGEETTYVHG